ncbi:MAG TPA: type I-B CRISPR-associated protein Cas7/Cst2/DevR [Candidatus Ratteibacteria bacterium]|nr:type I-B CRISPR-associated protein Cas7/Cst2/DevR [Candidatus Ratteibacteria bacterium]
MSKIVNGFMLIDAPWSALNNAGIDVGERTDNAVKVKIIRKGRDVYPYVSGQAVRYWWRETLAQKFGWKLSPVERVQKVAYTSANPIDYDDDDMFGYMRAAKEEVEKNGKKQKIDVTVTRISPLKNSPLLSIYPQTPTNDFGVMARQKEGGPVPFEHEFYSVILKGIFSIDIENVGKFYEIEKSGYENMSPKLIEHSKEMGLEHNEEEKFWKMPIDIRRKRIKEVILALPYLSGGAKLTEHLTDVSPKFLILAVLEGGNHIFMNVCDENGINFKALTQVIEDYKEEILSDVYIGKREGFLDDINKELDEFANKKWTTAGRREINIKINSINNIVLEFTKVLDEFIK